jgi:hypothetical protein
MLKLNSSVLSRSVNDVISLPTPARNKTQHVATVQLLIALQACNPSGTVRDSTLQLSKRFGYPMLSSQARTTKIHSRAKECPYLDEGHTQTATILHVTSQSSYSWDVAFPRCWILKTNDGGGI